MIYSILSWISLSVLNRFATLNNDLLYLFYFYSLRNVIGRELKNPSYFLKLPYESLNLVIPSIICSVCNSYETK